MKHGKNGQWSNDWVQWYNLAQWSNARWKNNDGTIEMEEWMMQHWKMKDREWSDGWKDEKWSKE